MTKRDFLKAGLGTGLALSGGASAFAQQAAALARKPAPPASGKAPVRRAKTKKLFKSPGGFPNGLEVTPEGLWIGE